MQAGTVGTHSQMHRCAALMRTRHDPAHLFNLNASQVLHQRVTRSGDAAAKGRVLRRLRPQHIAAAGAPLALDQQLRAAAGCQEDVLHPAGDLHRVAYDASSLKHARRGASTCKGQRLCSKSTTCSKPARTMYRCRKPLPPVGRQASAHLQQRHRVLANKQQLAGRLLPCLAVDNLDGGKALGGGPCHAPALVAPGLHAQQHGEAQHCARRFMRCR